MTAVDLKDAEKIHTERVAQCKAKGGEGDACTNDWRADVQGSMIFASWKFMQRNAKVTYFGWSVVDQVEGLRVQLTNADGSRTFAEIHRHGTRLYILEATVPARAPAPGLFQQSLMFIDEEGKSIRYRSIYTTGYSEGWKFPAPAPPRAGAAACARSRRSSRPFEGGDDHAGQMPDACGCFRDVHRRFRSARITRTATTTSPRGRR